MVLHTNRIHTLEVVTSSQQIETQLAQIEAQIEELQSSDFLLDAWVAHSRPAGKVHSYPRLQSRTAQFDGKKTRYLRRESVTEFQAACDRGRQLKRLTKLRDRLRAAISQ
jgi:Mg2+ and Co2+ transporter CorA